MISDIIKPPFVLKTSPNEKRYIVAANLAGKTLTDFFGFQALQAFPRRVWPLIACINIKRRALCTIGVQQLDFPRRQTCRGQSVIEPINFVIIGFLLLLYIAGAL